MKYVELDFCSFRGQSLFFFVDLFLHWKNENAVIYIWFDLILCILSIFVPEHINIIVESKR